MKTFYNYRGAVRRSTYLSITALFILATLSSTFAAQLARKNDEVQALSGTTKVITTNTVDESAGENGSSGWWFNRDLSTSSPYEFTKSQASIGDGSLYAKPISSTASDKFIAENFIFTPVSEINSISYDFLIGDGGTAADANEFYMNVYTNFAESDAKKYYDCKYDVIPNAVSSDPVTGFTTVTFNPTQEYKVTKRGGASASPYPCPASPADMDSDTTGEGATVRMFAINVGDTSADDEGLDGYLDNVVVQATNGTTTYDFEWTADPNNSHELSLGGYVFNNRNQDRDRDAGEEKLADWTLRLYEEAEAGWRNIDEDVTNENGSYSFKIKEPGTYHVCEVNQLKWEQVATDWSGTAYHVNTPNKSGMTDEAAYCATVGYDDTSNRSNKKYFGNAEVDPNNQHQLSLSGYVFSNWNQDRDRDEDEEVLSDWTLRLYQETGDGWIQIDEDTTGEDGTYGFSQIYEPGTYHTCEVSKVGWSQIASNWSGTPFHVYTQNLSGAADEELYCTTVGYTDKSDRSNKKYFGNIDSQAPLTEITNPTDGTSVNGIITINGQVTDEYPENSYLHIVGPNGYLKTDLRKDSQTIHELQWDTTTLEDGDYTIYFEARDRAGNKAGSRNNPGTSVDVVTVTVDNTAPATPTLTAPAHNSNVNGASVTQSWSTPSDDVDYYLYESYRGYAGGSLNNLYESEQEVTTPYRTIAGMENGSFWWRVKAVDHLGNESEWSQPWRLTVSSTQGQVRGDNTNTSNTSTTNNTNTQTPRVRQLGNTDEQGEVLSEETGDESDAEVLQLNDTDTDEPKETDVTAAANQTSGVNWQWGIPVLLLLVIFGYYLFSKRTDIK